MSANYATPQPIDKNGTPMQTNVPAAKLALKQYGSENASASSVLTFNDSTTRIEIAAVGGPAVMRWVASSDTQASIVSAASGANFDHVIASATVRAFVVPRESQAITSIVGANIQEGLYRRVAIKSVGVASVLTTEY